MSDRLLLMKMVMERGEVNGIEERARSDYIATQFQSGLKTSSHNLNGKDRRWDIQASVYVFSSWSSYIGSVVWIYEIVTGSHILKMPYWYMSELNARLDRLWQQNYFDHRPVSYFRGAPDRPTDRTVQPKKPCCCFHRTCFAVKQAVSQNVI